MEGIILGGRYELIEKIGGGGMAQVYKAKDFLLNRFVAVKILRQEFNDDEEFVKRFKIEAQSSAGLSHPNIVSIYDVGQDGIVQFIVMELIEGITLKEYIAYNGFLPWEEAVNIAIQICSAIDHAHRNHIIHRDIKPQNILMTDTGIAKVSDFGIARAVSASTITLTGNTVGSVHYFSPEQARGGFVDEKSDLYSIGITLYEMVTGKIPFDGDTPVSVALKHIQDTPVPPKVLKDTIPNGVNEIVMKAIKKDQNIRYQKATEMLEDLYRVLKQPEGGFVDDEEDSGYSTKRIGIVDEKILNETDKQNKNGKKKGKLKYWLVGAGALVLLLLIGYVGFRLVTTMIEPSSDYVVANYVGRDIATVEDELTKARIPYEVKPENSNNIKKGIIIAQDKKVGNTLKADGFERITLTVSDGVKLLKMPDYSSVDPRIAVDGLVNLGVNRDLIVQKEVNSDTIKSGLVIDTNPASNAEFKLTDTVTINVSKGPKVKTVSVPNLFGKTYLQAEQLLTAAGLIVGNIDQPTGSSDFIAFQNPASGTKLKEGSPVDIYFQKTVTWTVELKKPNKYPDSFNVTVYIRPSDTKTLRTIYNNTNIKSDFPLTFSIPVPTNGSTKADIYINDELLSTITVK